MLKKKSFPGFRVSGLGVAGVENEPHGGLGHRVVLVSGLELPRLSESSGREVEG